MLLKLNNNLVLQEFPSNKRKFLHQDIHEILIHFFILSSLSRSTVRKIDAMFIIYMILLTFVANFATSVCAWDLLSDLAIAFNIDIFCMFLGLWNCNNSISVFDTLTTIMQVFVKLYIVNVRERWNSEATLTCNQFGSLMNRKNKLSCYCIMKQNHGFYKKLSSMQVHVSRWMFNDWK